MNNLKTSIFDQICYKCHLCNNICYIFIICNKQLCMRIFFTLEYCPLSSLNTKLSRVRNNYS